MNLFKWIHVLFCTLNQNITKHMHFYSFSNHYLNAYCISSTMLGERGALMCPVIHKHYLSIY